MPPSYEFKGGKNNAQPRDQKGDRNRDRVRGLDREKERERDRHHDRPHDRDRDYRRDGQRDHYRGGDRGYRGSGGGGGGGSDRYRPEHRFTFKAYPRTSARPLLTRERETTPEYVGPAKDENETQKKFISLDEVSDSDEAEMEMSPRDKPGDGEESAVASAVEPPHKKQIRESTPPITQPKWSNPDPYTVLPPEDETQSHGKKKDIVKLIRKARVTHSTISEDASTVQITSATKSQPEAQQKSRQPNVQPQSQPKPQAENSGSVNSNPVVANEDFISFDKEDLSAFMPPDSAPKGPKGRSDDQINTRKRGYDEAMGGPTKKKPKNQIDGSILDEWRPRPGYSATPWLNEEEAVSCIPATRLHNEILQFYDWVKPQPFEDVVRNDLIQRLSSSCERRYYGSQLRAFGSYASGVYLPMADMDLVLLSRQFLRSGSKVLGVRPKDVYIFSRFLTDIDIAVPGSIEPIAHARVPIVKFVDRLTGLRVDVSFDNSSGIIANDTFQLWKKEYPAMPIIVSVIKQFLLLRGLNEVPTGGLGGFSTICLVTSLLQHLQYRDEKLNLGSILLDFFDFYATKFDYDTIGIQFDPAGYFNKRVAGLDTDRLSIMDPNNPDNNISGSTKEIDKILDSFDDAFRSLRRTMAEVAIAPSTEHMPPSILECILGADYSAYERQRLHMQYLFLKDPRMKFPPPGAERAYSPPPPQAPIRRVYNK